MSHFCLLSRPEAYTPQSLDLTSTPEAVRFWLEHFDTVFELAIQHAGKTYDRTIEKMLLPAREQFRRLMDEARHKAQDGQAPSLMELNRILERSLQGNGVFDPFGQIKGRAIETASRIYVELCRQLHAMAGDDKWLHLLQAVFAGNRFDIGAQQEEFRQVIQSPEQFLQAIEAVQSRPWLVDDFELLVEDLSELPPLWGKAVFFVDNAGADFVLGAMPLARELALRGTMVVLAANERPALNDMTVDDTIETVRRLAAMDPELAAMISAEMVEVVSTGSRLPVLDLSNVSDELNEACQDADLVILEGSGRGLETNYDAEFVCDSLILGMAKNPLVAAALGGKPGDCVCKYTQVELPEEPGQ